MLHTVQMVLNRAKELGKLDKKNDNTNKLSNILTAYMSVCKVELVILAIIWALLMTGLLMFALMYVFAVNEFLGLFVSLLPIIFIIRHVVILAQCVWFSTRTK